MVESVFYIEVTALVRCSKVRGWLILSFNTHDIGMIGLLYGLVDL